MKAKLSKYVGSILLSIFVYFNYSTLMTDSFKELSLFLTENQVSPPLPATELFLINIHRALLSFAFSFLLNYYVAFSLSIIIGFNIVLNMSVSALGYLSGYEPNFLLLLFLSTIASCIGTYFGFLQSEEYKQKNESNTEGIRMFGISKKMIALLIFSWNPIAMNLHKFTALAAYNIEKLIRNDNFLYSLIPFNGIPGVGQLVKYVMAIVISWAICIGIFYWGVDTIRNKTAQYRMLRIIVLFIVIPLAVLVIPIIRNLHWFY